MYPVIQANAQAELDKVLGGELHFPLFSDQDNLPYVRAVITEVLRWGVVTPSGVAHRLMEDDVYNGKVIPAGTVVIPNIRGMLHDPIVYPDSLRFDPTRYLEDKGIPVQQDPRTSVFGFGRRYANFTIRLGTIYLMIKFIVLNVGCVQDRW